MIPIGTRSLLFGVHQMLIHPLFMAIAWTRLYGFPWDPRLWVAFFVHDLGYWGKKDMDGSEGERHVELGARIMRWLFDDPCYCCYPNPLYWYHFCLFHSRFYASRAHQPISRLCVCDKLVIAITPWWLYLPLAHLSGEVHEYMARVRPGEKYAHERPYTNSSREWHRQLVNCVRNWVEEHKDI